MGDACYKKVKKAYEHFPSARASQAIAKCRKSAGEERRTEKGTALRRWEREEWKDMKTGRPCGAGGRTEYCRPTKRVSQKTPATAGELKAGELKKKIAEKEKKGMGRRVSPIKRQKARGRVAAAPR